MTSSEPRTRFLSPPREPAAFTLIELLVVIAIIAILAALLFPVGSRAIASANASKSVGNLRGLGALVHLYAAEKDGSIFPAMAAHPTYWDSGLMDYLNAKDRLAIWKSPADKAPRNGTKKWPTDATLVAPPRSYFANAFVFNLWGVHPAYPGHPGDTAIKLLNIPKPANFWILAEYYPDKASAGGIVVGEHAASILGVPPANVHGKGVYALMLDGHVESHDAGDSAWWWGMNRQ
jgi:prepilin-type N-terminal cleavage/methylation domain-containing protein/prepilin-type processing-associated H-X9-DG protein